MDEPHDYRQRPRQQLKLQSYADFSDVDLKAALLTIWRRKWLVFWSMFLAASITAGIVLSITPVYTASAEILLESQKTATIALGGAPSPAADQLQVITSRPVAQRVVQKLGLAADPEFNDALQEDPWLVLFWRQLSPNFLARFSSNFQPLNDDLLARIQSERIIDNLLERLTAKTVETSNVVEIDFVSERSTKAAQIVDEIANAYLEQRLEAKFAEVQLTTGWLDQRIGDLRKQVQTAETAVEAFRRQSGLVESSPGETLAGQQISEVNTQLILARTARAEREARLNQMQQLMRSGGAGLGSAGEVLNSALINSLITQEVEVKRRLADLSQEYGSRHPLFINARAELQNLQDKISLEMGRVAQNLQNEVNVARERERSLEESVQQLEAKVADSNDAAVTLRSLEREAAASRSILETFLQQFQQFKTQDDAGSQRPDASVISYAALPQFPSFPKKTLAVAAAMVVGGLLGVVLALLAEHFQSVFHSGEQVEEELGLAVIGSVPDLHRFRQVRKVGVPSYLLGHPNSAAAEAVRGINARILHDRGGRSTTVVQFASAEPEEGKTSLSISAAQLLAKAGRRVLLIDADFRHSNVARTLGLRPVPGLVEIMAGKNSLVEALQRDGASGAYVIAAGRFASAAHDYLASGHLAELLREVRDSYELIFIDSPPILSLSDSGLIAKAVDCTVFVARWGRTRKETVRYALKQIETSGGSILGVVLSFVDVRRASQYGYGDSGQYQGKHKKYYVS